MCFSICKKKKTGGCAVHHWCAVWSEGVKRMENEELENVDKAVISGTQRVSALSIDLNKLILSENVRINRLPSQNLTC